MLKKNVVLLVALCAIIPFAQNTFAQGDLNLDMEQYYAPPENAAQNLNDAVDPLLDMFGFLAGSGLYNTADVHGILGFDAGIKVAAMRVGDNQLPFMPELPKDLQNGPLGEENIIGLPMLHVGVGVLPNLELMGRFFTYPMGDPNSAEGNVTLIGVGAKYGLLQSILLPKIAVVGAYHYLTVPDEFDFGSVNSVSGALVVSKGFPIVTLYGSAGVDYTTLQINLPDPLPDPDAYTKTNFRGNVGLRMTIFPLVFLNVDYNFGAVQGLSAGLGLSIR